MPFSANSRSREWTYDPFRNIAKRRGDGVKTKSINPGLAVVRRILDLASGEWMDNRGMTWLETAPEIRLFPLTDAPLPILFRLRDNVLFRESPAHLARVALFKVNTGTRAREVCGLKWGRAVKVLEFATSDFLTFAERMTNSLSEVWRFLRC